jgi:hypothetical protein
VVECAASEARSEEGFLDVDRNSVRKWFGLVNLMTRICSVGYSSRLLGATPVSAPMDVAAALSGAVGLGSPCVATGVPLTGGVGLTGAGATGAAWEIGTGADGAGVID